VKAPYNTKFLFRIDEDLHKEIKIRAAMRNVGMGHWIIQAIMERMAKEDRYGKKQVTKE
jgi:predicted HicB family RNase H-like nuclease